MEKLRGVACLVVVSASLYGSVIAAGKPPKDVSVLVTFGSGALDTLRSDGLRARGYDADYADAQDNVLALVQGSGNFRFFTQSDTSLPAGRNVCFDFGTQSVPFVVSQCVNVGQPMHAYPTGDVAIQNLRYGQSVRKLTRFTWDEGSVRYRIGYGTDMDMDGLQDSPAVTVTCIAPANTSLPCTSWVLAPETDGTAALFRFALTVAKRGVINEGPAELVGMYHMPFVQTFTVKP